MSVCVCVCVCVCGVVSLAHTEISFHTNADGRAFPLHLKYDHILKQTCVMYDGVSPHAHLVYF